MNEFLKETYKHFFRFVILLMLYARSLFNVMWTQWNMNLNIAKKASNTPSHLEGEILDLFVRFSLIIIDNNNNNGKKAITTKRKLFNIADERNSLVSKQNTYSKSFDIHSQFCKSCLNSLTATSLYINYAFLWFLISINKFPY